MNGSDSLLAICKTVLRFGILAAASGTGVYSIREGMDNIGLALGLSHVDCQITFNTVLVTCSTDTESKTLISPIPAMSVNASCMIELKRLSDDIPKCVNCEYINEQLDEIATAKKHYGLWLTSLAAFTACAAFCFLNNGAWEECLAAGIGAGTGQFFRASMARFHLNQLAVALLAGCIAFTVYLLIGDFLNELGFNSPRHDAGFTSAALFLIPGFPLITSAIDMSRLDFTAGLPRMVYAVLMITIASVSAWIISSFAHLTLTTAPGLDLTQPELFILRILASFCGVFGFGSLFNSPAKVALGAATIGMLCNTLRLYLVDFGLPLQGAAPCASLCVGLLAAFLSRRLKCPRVTLSVPAVLIMIPGTAAYRALVYGNNGMAIDSFTNATSVVFTVVGIVIGLVAARMLTDKEWVYEKKLPKIRVK